MSYLATAEDISGRVYLYDMDFKAAKTNKTIGNKYNLAEGAKSKWDNIAVKILRMLTRMRILLLFLYFRVHLTK